MAPEDQSKFMIVVEAATSRDGLDRVAAVLEATDVAALLIAPAGQVPLDAATAKPLVDLAKAKSVTALLMGDARLARALGADGVHVPWGKDATVRYGEAREVLGDSFVVGADAGRSRHDGMSFGEAGADYVGFGIPEHVEDRETARARRLSLIEWWSEIFEVPCVAFDVETTQEAAALARAGADFVTVGVPRDLSAAELSRWAQELADALKAHEAAA